MPSRPLSDATVQLLHALRESLAQALADSTPLEERSMFGCQCFFVDGKLCLGVKSDELLVRLPPSRHSEFLEMQGLRELSPGGGMRGYFWIEPQGYASRAQWTLWIREALAYNPEAKASPRKRKPGNSNAATDAENSTPTGLAPTGAQRQRAARGAVKAQGKSSAPKSAKTASRKTHPIFGSE